MAIHPFDFKLQADVFSTPEGRDIFAETSRIQNWLDFEAALALSQAELGIIPAAAAGIIQDNARLSRLDEAAIAEEYTRNRNSLMPVIKALRQACGSAGEFVHYGATTQDVIDSGQIIALKQVLKIIKNNLLQIEDLLINMARRYRNQAMIGRTHSQQAVPITFGLKTAVWLSELGRHCQRLEELKPRLLKGQLSGAVGTMAALGNQGREVARLTMGRLGLGISTVSWHTSRDNIAEAGCFFAMLSATAAKIANEIFQLGKTEIMELRESPPSGKSAGSSTMPHKRNPVICERIAAINSHIRSLSGVIMEAMIHEDERDPRALWSEWLAVPQIAVYTLTSLQYLQEVLSNLEVNPDAMRQNLLSHKEMILSEWLLFRLSAVMGKKRAHEALSPLIKRAQAEKQSLKDLLSAAPEIKAVLSPADLSNLDHPENYTGLAARIVDDAIMEAAARRRGNRAGGNHESR
ncbi:Adenylosuccinate lyase @ SAICAR lyase [hydrothermal vent metagenome]|uniref:Adenylosuccinate lyase @ SAICAR lyase n=1 Tax=hydrothermal vent metagenome TaxID=652676 RepID=A0A3B0VRJ9_9ZZZZ